MGLFWTEQLSVGNALIDSDHKVMIGLANDVEHALESRNSTDLLRALERLDSFISAHSANEERIAQALNFPFAQHNKSHQYLQRELMHMKQQLEDMGGMWSDRAIEHFTGSIEDWVLLHIIGEDALMKPVLQASPYDFKPADGTD